MAGHYPATDKQIGYLRRLLREAPNVADGHGIDEDDLFDIDRRTASHYINLILGNSPDPEPVEDVPTLAEVADGNLGQELSIEVPSMAEANETPKTFEPSAYQAAIFAAITNSDDNLFVDAVAGSGKTTTIVQALKLLESKRALFCAFNKAIADELRTRVPEHVDVKTMHSLGFQALRTSNRNIRLDDDIVKTVWDETLPRSLGGPERTQAVNLGDRLTSMLKNCLVEPDDVKGINGLLDHFAIDDNGVGAVVVPLLPYVFSRLDCSQQITFDDMIYRVVKQRLPLPKYDVVMVDEAQDLNPAQIAMILQMGCRTIAVGDPFQSIYGFRGADVNAISNLVSTLNMRTMPLSITYRCPTSHVRMAKALVPTIEARPGAPEGTIDSLTLEGMLEAKILEPGVLAVCRTNAPLVSTAFTLIRAGVPTMVRGRDIGQGLISLIRKLNKGDDDVRALIEKADAYHQSERAKLVRRKATETRLQALNDRLETLYALTEGAETVTEVIKRAETLFSDSDGRGMVVLSSVHKAKGLEAETVIILQPWLMPLKVKQDWERQQERNVQYVAWTRSKHRLVFETKGQR